LYNFQPLSFIVSLQYLAFVEEKFLVFTE